MAFPGVVDRYYSRYYSLDVGGGSLCDQFCHVHSNKLFVLGLAPTHPIIQERKAVLSVAYVDGGQGEVVGKKKTGARPLQALSKICEFVCADGSTYNFLCGIPDVQCQLLETNSRLVSDPSLLLSKPETDGFVAIVNVKLSVVERAKSKLVPEDQFRLLRGLPPRSVGSAAHRGVVDLALFDLPGDS
eukprot:gnl/Spiro4/24118_TR11964_c0_g1_i1.p1 gnl/Spiro4/24118_TR11964_c0_g1~~gnl/Spiro4/24118_TR11964_c0_g1_i1.p1  ORF type:complete len:187 (+),score=23.38 gnl/Spiro4/24118_TR11964_c0_g1_i1:98-658(+)